ncbi:MAG: NUDIX hydrolase [Patescibacteria group bacterium]
MQIKSIINTPDKSFEVIYNDIESESELGDRKVKGVHAFCFYKDQLVIVYAKKKDSWTPPGGGTEEGETARETVVREVQEESNMRVIKQRFIGFQDIYEFEVPTTQTRSVCLVEPYGDFMEDPDDGEITEIKLIDPKDYKQYFDWGPVGDHIMERALDIKAQMDLEVNK